VPGNSKKARTRLTSPRRARSREIFRSSYATTSSQASRGLPYLLLQGAHGLSGLLPKLLSPLFGEPYLRAQPRLLLPGGLVDLGEPDAGGVEGLAHDEDRALAGDVRRQVGDRPGEALDGQTPRRRLVPLLGHLPPPGGPPPRRRRLDLLARVVVGTGVVVLVRVPPE
jgi:hypothetical protein